jgi:hypothetical protein
LPVQNKQVVLDESVCSRLNFPSEVFSEEKSSPESKTLSCELTLPMKTLSLASAKCTDLRSSCGHQSDSAISNRSDMNEQNLLPKKYALKIRTGLIVYPFISQEATTGLPTSNMNLSQCCVDFRRNLCRSGSGSLTGSKL